MDDIPTMFSYNALVKTATGRLELYHRGRRSVMTKSGSILSIVGSPHTYELRTSGLAVLKKAPEKKDPTQAAITNDSTKSVETTNTTDIPSEPLTQEDVLKKAPEKKDPTQAAITNDSTKSVETTNTTDIPSEPLTQEDVPKTYYIKASANRQLNTEDFGIFSHRMWNKKPMSKGTRIAVAIVPRKNSLWPVPRTTTLSFLPMSADKPGNIGEVLVTSQSIGNTPSLWNLEGPITDGFLFYTLVKDIDRPVYFTT